MKYYCEDSQQVLQELNSQKSGLTEKEAAERLLQNGANELKAARENPCCAGLRNRWQIR